MDTPLLDEDLLTDLFDDLGVETFSMMLDAIEAEMAQTLDRLSGFCSEGNTDEMRRAAHKLAGLAGQFAMSETARVARLAEAGTLEIPEARIDDALREIAASGLSELRRRVAKPGINQEPMVA